MICVRSMNRVRFCNVRLMSILGSCQGPRLQRSTIYVHDVDLSAISVFHNFNNSLTKESTRRGLYSKSKHHYKHAGGTQRSHQSLPKLIQQWNYFTLFSWGKKKKKDNRHTYPSKYINSTYTLSIKSNCNKGKFKKKKTALQRRKNWTNHTNRRPAKTVIVSNTLQI